MNESSKMAESIMPRAAWLDFLPEMAVLTAPGRLKIKKMYDVFVRLDGHIVDHVNDDYTISEDPADWPEVKGGFKIDGDRVHFVSQYGMFHGDPMCRHAMSLTEAIAVLADRPMVQATLARFVFNAVKRQPRPQEAVTHASP